MSEETGTPDGVEEQEQGAASVAPEGAKVIDTVYRDLFVDLTDEEVLERAHALTSKDRELDSVEAEAKRVAKSFKDKIGGIRTAKDELREIVHSRQEERSIECDVLHDYTGGEVLTVRKDTGEVVERRTMSGFERQMGMDLGEGEDLGEDGDDDGEDLGPFDGANLEGEAPADGAHA